MIYRTLILDDSALVNQMLKWKNRLHIELDYCEFIKDINRMYSVTISSKLRSFHYKFLKNTIITNVQLKWYQIIETDKCSNCQSERESITHLFYECETVSSL